MPSQPSQSERTNSRRTIPGRCQHLRVDGKQCADAVYPGHTSLCHYHLSQQLRGITGGERIAADLLATIGNFQSATGIHIALSKLLIHQLTGRISRRDATALLYNLQLMLQILPAVKSEIHCEGYDDYWSKATSRMLAKHCDLDKLTDPALLPESNSCLHPHLPAQRVNSEPAPNPASCTPVPPRVPLAADPNRPASPGIRASTNSAGVDLAASSETPRVSAIAFNSAVPSPYSAGNSGLIRCRDLYRTEDEEKEGGNKTTR